MKIQSTGLAGLGWIVAFAALGAAAMVLGFWGHPHPLPGRLAWQFAAIGVGIGINLAVLALCFALLPGARRNPALPQPFGLAQGIWGLAGFGITMVGGGALLANILTVENFVLIARHSPARIDFSSPVLLRTTALAGEVTAAFWVAWYLRRLGPARAADGSATGIAWRAAPARAYVTALAAAVGLIALVLALYHALPPDMDKLQALPMARLFEGSAISVLPLVILATVVAPVVEEIVFRGIAFAGLATRFGTGWASVITTGIFMAAHAQVKIHYLPGFLDVGLMAVVAIWLRLKFHSIRPGILLHIIYNTGSMLLASSFG
jgi:membrane protease YdiL (CAAX protease family)